MSNIDYDKFGYCALCHCNLMKRTYDSDIDSKTGKVKGFVNMLSGKSTFLELSMNDGSKMRVTVCKKCNLDYNHNDDSKRLMESVIKGWEVECDQLVADVSKPEWTPEKKESYMRIYSKKEIVI